MPLPSFLQLIGGREYALMWCVCRFHVFVCVYTYITVYHGTALTGSGNDGKRVVVDRCRVVVKNWLVAKGAHLLTLKHVQLAVS